MRMLTSFKQQLINEPAVRWSSSFAFVVFVCASVVLTALNWNVSSTVSPAPPMAAMMVDLAPMPIMPEHQTDVARSGPAQEKTPPPPELIPKSEVKPLSELPVIKEAEALLPKELPPELIEEEPEIIEEEPEPIKEEIVQEDSAPPVFEALPDEIAAAPMEAAVSVKPSQALATWQSTLLGQLERHKRYPRKARRNRQESVVYVSITIDREGTVLDYRLTQASTYEALNQETLALIARAQPFPPPPPRISGDTVKFVVPVEFYLH